jgi:hypothetical protein
MKQKICKILFKINLNNNNNFMINFVSVSIVYMNVIYQKDHILYLILQWQVYMLKIIKNQEEKVMKK